MAKKNIVELFNELEDFIEGCKSQTFSSNKIVVPRDQLLNMIREIKIKIPSEVEQSNKVIENRDFIVAEARKQEDAILQDARNKAQRMVTQSEIMALATEQAKELIGQAQAKGQEIIAQANQEADFLRTSALGYTNDVMAGLSDFTARYLEEEKEKYNYLVQSLQEQYKTIETNRAQITAQLDSGKAPKGDGKQSIKKAPQRETRAAEPKREKQEESFHTSYSAPEIRVNTEHPAFNNGSDHSSATVNRSSSKASTKKEDKKGGANSGMPVDDDFDDLDELYLDEY